MRQFKNKSGFVFQFYDEEYELTQIKGGLEKTLESIFGVSMNLKDFSGNSITPEVIYNGLVNNYQLSNGIKSAIELLVNKYNLTQTKLRILKYE